MPADKEPIPPLIFQTQPTPILVITPSFSSEFTYKTEKGRSKDKYPIIVSSVINIYNWWLKNNEVLATIVNTAELQDPYMRILLRGKIVGKHEKSGI